MLVLTRSEGESIYIGGRDICVTLVEIRGDKVRLGIQAPDGMAIHRKEVWASIERTGKDPADRASLEHGVGKERRSA